ncbi:MAG: flagellar assembly protein FliX [Proteobacteria bacterium]|nr:flagellar assembly protein FliX [Pseudomonadota bacterium]
MARLSRAGFSKGKTMKIIAPGVVGSTQSTRKTTSKKVGDGSFSSLISGGDEEESVQETGAVRATGLIGSLLSLQEVETPTEKPIKRGKNLLTELEKIRVGLLQGSLNPTTMQTLRAEIAQGREHVSDPKLQEILDEIDVRAAVELAKLEKANKTGA